MLARIRHTVSAFMAVSYSLFGTSSTHFAKITVEDIVDFFGVILVQSTLETSVLAKFNLALPTFLFGTLNSLTVEALYFLNFVELHSLDLASFFVFVLIIVTEFARIEYFAARCFDVAVALVMWALVDNFHIIKNSQTLIKIII